MVRVPGWKHWDRVMDGGVGLETLGQGDGTGAGLETLGQGDGRGCRVRNAWTG